MESNWLNLMNLLKRNLVSTEIVYNSMNKKIFNKSTEERASRFRDLRKRFCPDNLIYRYKTEGISPKDLEIMEIG